MPPPVLQNNGNGSFIGGEVWRGKYSVKWLKVQNP